MYYLVSVDHYGMATHEDGGDGEDGYSDIDW
jgi:hypothetical protein